MKKLQDLNSPLFDGAKLSNDVLKKVYGGYAPAVTCSPSVCNGKAGSTNGGTDTDSCTDDM
jgi:hypothetical protein